MANSPPIEPSDSAGSWGPCESDELVALGSRLRTSESRHRQFKTVAVTAAASFVAILALGSLYLVEGGGHGGISCSECHAQFAEYHAHLTGENRTMDAETVQSMAEHLAECDICRPKFEQLFPGVLASVLRDSGHWLVRSDVQAAISFLHLAAI